MVPPPAPEAPRPPGDDELFAQIVAGFKDEPTDPVPRWPVSEDVDDGPAEPTTRSILVPRPDEVIEDLPGWLEPEALEDEGHFEPPPAPSIPRLRPQTVFAGSMLLAGLAVLFAPYQIGLDDSVIFILLGLLLTVGGAALLVAWMRDAPPSGSGPDHGAVV